MDTEPDSWDKQGIAAVLLGVKGLLVEDLEMAKGGLTVLSDKARDELAEEAHESANEAERAGVHGRVRVCACARARAYSVRLAHYSWSFACVCGFACRPSLFVLVRCLQRPSYCSNGL